MSFGMAMFATPLFCCLYPSKGLRESLWPRTGKMDM